MRGRRILFAAGAGAPRWLVVFVVAALLVAPLVAAAAGACVITGRVTGPDGTTGLPGIQVKAYAFMGAWSLYTQTTTDADGVYSLNGLFLNTDHAVQFIDPAGGYVSEYYDNRPTRDTADIIRFTSVGTRSDVNAALAGASSVRGTIRDSAGTPLANVQVHAHQALGDGTFQLAVTGSGQSDATGAYAINGIPEGSYALQFVDLGVCAPHYRSTIEPYGATVLEDSTPVTVAFGQTLTGIDETMFQWGRMEGTATMGGAAVPNATVVPFRGEGTAWIRQLAAMAQTDAGGTWATPRLYPGRYHVRFEGLGFPTQFHAGSLSVEGGTDVVISENATTTLSAIVFADDATPPESSVTGIPAGWASAITATITSDDGTDGSGVASIHYQFGSSEPATYTAPFAVAVEGSTTMSYWALDRFGNEETPHKTIPVMLDATRPTASCDAAGTYIDSFAPTITGADSVSGVKEISYRLDSDLSTTTVSGTSFTLPAVTGVGGHSLAYVARDEAGNESLPHTATFTVAVDAPVATIDSVSPNPAVDTGSVTFSGHGTDAITGHTITAYEWSSDVDGVLGTTATLTKSGLTPGSHTIGFRVRCSSGVWSAPVTFGSALVVDASPVLSAIGAKTVDELTQLSFQAAASDTDVPADTLTFTLGGGAPSGAAITSGGAFTWTPTEAQGPGSYPITIIVSDGRGGTDSESITVTVSEVNLPPVLAAIGVKTVNELSQLAFTATATDPDLPANTRTFTLGGGAPTGAAITSGGAFTWTPTEAQGPGDYSITVNVGDGHGGTDTETINVHVDEVNSSPVLSAIGAKTVDELVQLSFTAAATDPESDTLHYTLGGGAPSGAAITDAGAFTWTPTEAQGPGSYPVTVTVSDGGSTDSETFTVTVSEVNLPPVLAAIGARTVNELSQLAFTATATDPDLPANTRTFSLALGAPTGAAITSGGAFTWTPTEAQGPGDYSITVNVGDGHGGTDTETINVHVDEVSEPSPTLMPVWRFYNMRAGGHFFTSDPVERDIVLARYSNTFRPEGVAFSVNTGNPGNSAPLYRFYNTSAGGHFFTASTAERDIVLSRYAATYRPEGASFNVSAEATTGATPVYRFYNTRAGGHFFTTSTAERDVVLTRYWDIYSNENVGFYLAP